MGRRTWLAVCLAAVLGLMATWLYGPTLVRHLVFSRPAQQSRERIEQGDVEALKTSVADALSSLGLDDEQRTGHDELEQQDSQGTWDTIQERWQLPSESDPVALGRRIEALVASSDPSAEIYVVQQEPHRVQLRFYAGSRLAQVLDLETSLDSWPRVGPGAPPLLALVVFGADEDPHGTRQLMDQAEPLGLALSPYSPFTLRLSRDALLTHTEVLAMAADDVPLPESLQAVPHASGLVVTALPPGEIEAQSLALAGVYVIDATEEGMGAAWMRALQDAGVPYQRAHTSKTELDRYRYRHSAAREGAAMVVVPAAQAAIESEQIASASERGFRRVFPAEIVEASRD
jgi:hypothetical protein